MSALRHPLVVANSYEAAITLTMKNIKQNLFNANHLIKVVSWILICFNKPGTVPLGPLTKLITNLGKIQDSRGRDFLILFVKDARGNLMNYLSGSPERLPLAKTTKDGIPKILGDLIPIVRRKSYLAIAMIYTILFSTRSLKTGKTPSIDSITAPYNGDLSGVDRHFESFWRTLGYRYSLQVPKYLEAKTDVYRSKAGPNGHALVSAYIDAQALPDDLIKDLIILGGSPIKSIITSTRDSVMWNYFKDNFPPLISILKKGKPPIYRKLSFFADKENKVRVIGILDWFSQLSLKPLHDFLMKVLSRIPQDCTNDQGKFIDLISNQEIYYSIDLSNATDRFPIELIRRLLCSKLPTEYVNAWKRVMVDHPFVLNINNKPEMVYYNTGNPMGAYSSFNSFALTHHYLIYYCCKETGKDWKTLPYALLGDDIVICDAVVAERYLSLLKQLDIEYSKAKTHKSKDFYEFAKRIFYQGVEVSPFPYSALKECTKTYSLLFTLLWSLKNKGNWMPKDDITSTGLDYFRIVEGWRRPYLRDKVKPKAWLLLGILDIVSGLRSAGDFLNEIIRTRNYQLPILSEEVCKNILGNCIVQAFAESNIAKALDYGSMDMPLWGITQTMGKGFFQYKKQFRMANPGIQVGDAIPFSTPLGQAQLAVQKEYRELLSHILELDKAGEDWSFKLRTFALPKSDKSLLDKGDYLLSRAAKSFGALVDEQLMILTMYPQLLVF